MPEGVIGSQRRSHTHPASFPKLWLSVVVCFFNALLPANDDSTVCGCASEEMLHYHPAATPETGPVLPVGKPHSVSHRTTRGGGTADKTAVASSRVIQKADEDKRWMHGVKIMVCFEAESHRHVKGCWGGENQDCNASLGIGSVCLFVCLAACPRMPVRQPVSQPAMMIHADERSMQAAGHFCLLTWP